MFHPTRMTQLVLTVVALGALAGCGKAAPVQQHPGLIDDAITRRPAESAQQTIAVDTQRARETQADRAENQRASQPGPGHDHGE